MAKGLKIPVGVTATGGTAAVEGEEHNLQLIGTSLSSSESANAWQQEVNLGEDMIFGLDESTLRTTILRRLYQIFEAFEANKLYQLDRDSIEWSREQDGELTLELRYIDLETDEPRTFRKTFTTGA